MAIGRFLSARQGLFLAFATLSCGDRTAIDESKPEGPNQATCDPPHRLVDDRCVAPGAVDVQNVGMSDGDCGEGFAHDGDVGCSPLLPAEACPEGTMAVPGDEICAPVMECAAGQWGAIEVDATTQHVDQAFVGTSDGSAAAPWTTIGAALTAANVGATVAVAAGSYAESLEIRKTVRLEGMCPQNVEIVGGVTAAVFIRQGADGTVVRGVATRGIGDGIVLSGSSDVLVERVHVHHNDNRGLSIESTLGPTSMTLRRALVEHNNEIGIFVGGAFLVTESSVIRDTTAGVSEGFAISFRSHPVNGDVGGGTITNSLLERNEQHGVNLTGAEVTFESTVIRDTLPYVTQPMRGSAINVSHDQSGNPSRAVLLRSMVERNAGMGVNVQGSEMGVVSTVLRDVSPINEERLGRGFNVVQNTTTDFPSTFAIHGSLVERTHDLAIHVSGSQAEVLTTVVRDNFGRGISIQQRDDILVPSIATVTSSRIERNAQFGIVVVGAEVTIDNTLISTAMPGEVYAFGDGIAVAAFEIPTLVNLESSTIEHSERAGLLNFGAHASIGRSLIRCAAFDINAEPIWDNDYVIDDLGDNACGCPDAVDACKAVSVGLEPPLPPGM